MSSVDTLTWSSQSPGSVTGRTTQPTSPVVQSSNLLNFTYDTRALPQVNYAHLYINCLRCGKTSNLLTFAREMLWLLIYMGVLPQWAPSFTFLTANLVWLSIHKLVGTSHLPDLSYYGDFPQYCFMSRLAPSLSCSLSLPPFPPLLWSFINIPSLPALPANPTPSRLVLPFLIGPDEEIRLLIGLPWYVLFHWPLFSLRHSWLPANHDCSGEINDVAATGAWQNKHKTV